MRFRAWSSHAMDTLCFSTAGPCLDMAEQCQNTFTSCTRPFSCSSPLPHVMRFALTHSMFLQRFVFFFSIRDVVQVTSNFHESGRAHGVEVFRHCSAVFTHGPAVEKHSVSIAWLLHARKRMSRVSPLTLRVQRHI